MTYGFVLLMISTVTMITTSPMIMNIIIGNGTLTPLVAWLPYDITTSPTIFYLTYIYQAMCLYAFGPVNLGHDTLICGFMMLAAAHFRLLQTRLRELPQISKVERGQEKKPSGEAIKRFEGRIVAEHIRHHLHIIKFAEDINDIFSPTIAAQFCLSAVILSMAVYQMAVNFDNPVKFVSMALYLSCMFSQLFMFCWFGNEVTVKISDLGQAIYEIDWTDLHVQTVKDLMTIMIRCRRPSVMSCGTIITLSLDSFVKVIKVTYSALNFLLQRSGH